MNISVVIPALNEADKIGNCLNAILNQSLLPYEIIVVDNGSTDNTAAVARGWGVRVIYEGQRGRAKALQTGIEAARGYYIAFTDADCLPHEHWLLTLACGMSPSVAGVGGKFEDIGDSLWVQTINSTFKSPFSGARSRWAEPRVIKSLSVCGANGIVRKSDILKAGGFRVDLEGAEDLEFSTRLGKLGKLVYIPTAVVYHNHNRGLKSFLTRSYAYGKHRCQARLNDRETFIARFSLILWLLMPFYALAVGLIGLLSAIQNKRPIFTLTVPVALAAQHTGFIAGWWKYRLFDK